MASPTAKKLCGNLTDAEQRLWHRLRKRQCGGFRFRRQVPLGAYIVDFACLPERLVVEVDGGQHADDVARDAVRTGWLEQKGYRVIRFWNHDVLENTDGVVEAILQALRSAPPP